MKLSQKIISGIAAISLGVTLAACEKKEVKRESPKVVKTERVVVDKASAAASLESLDRRVTDTERRMAVARRQYAKDRQTYEADRAAIRARIGQ